MRRTNADTGSEQEPYAKKQGNAYYSRMDSPNCANNEYLHNCPKDWEMTVELMKKYRGLEGEIDWENFFTNDFLP